MKQTNKLPRRVGYSLFKSLNSMAEKLLYAQEMTSSTYNDEVRIQMVKKNKTLFAQRDVDALQSIRTFYEDTIAQLDKKRLMPAGAFISVAQHSKAELKYVSTPTAVGIVLTTAMLKRVLELSTIVGREIQGDKKADRRVRFVCETNGYGARESSVEFLRILDVLRYFQEVKSKLIEISLEGVHNDWMIENNNNRSYYSRGCRGADSSESIQSLFPMVSDRYQEDSWNHYLNTLYSGLCTPDNICSINTTLPMTVMLAELRAVVSK